LSAEDEGIVRAFLEAEGNRKFYKGCARVKNTAGSAGLRRYIVYFKLPRGVEAVELKPLATPATMVGRTVELISRQEIFKKAVSTYFGAQYHVAYYPVLVQGRLYQRRPLWAGNVGIKEGALSSSDLREVLLYQARVLGHFHRASNATGPFNFTPEKWEELAVRIEKKWKSEFAE
jgi:hypothetical protein